MVDKTDSPLDLAFSALADPTRRAILLQLLESDLTVKEVAAAYTTSLAAISKHLQILTKSGLIRQIKQGREKTCQLEPGAMREVSIWMEGFGAFSASDLDALETKLIDLGFQTD